MRRGNDNAFVFGDDGALAGVCLGADFTAEHECGIKGIRRAFGIDDAALGIAKRTITKHPVQWYATGQPRMVPRLQSGSMAGFSTFKSWDDKPVTITMVMRIGEVREPSTIGKSIYYDKLQTAWDQNGFCAFSADPNEQMHLKAIFDALQADDAIIMLGGQNGWIGNRGLLIGILSQMPQTVKDTLLAADQEYIRLTKAFADTGIEAKLQKAGCRWFALSPRFKTDGSITVWLNPMEQQKNNFGWFSIADLELWAEGKGPIPMKGRA
jgi:hypothetical protein